MSEANAEYSLVMHKLVQIDELSHRLKAMSGDMDRIVSAGRECWRGEAANAYYNSCAVLKSGIKEASENMRDFSSAILCAAEKNAAEKLVQP